MFTGIIEEAGTVKAITLTKNGGTVNIACQKVLEHTKIGDSIAVNGICLTVVALSATAFVADVMNETLNHTSLRGLKNGVFVNLERALSLKDRLGGHIVSGHIDGTGTILKIQDNGIAVLFTIGVANDLAEDIIKKGSIAVDGISLTVVSAGAREFTVSVIPHTIAETNLRTKKIGSLVNLETDVIGKYIKKFLFSQKHNDENLMVLLAENGFL